MKNSEKANDLAAFIKREVDGSDEEDEDEDSAGSVYGRA